MMKLNITTIEKLDKKEISKRTMQWDTQQLLKEVEDKKTLKIYKEFKKEINQEDIYDNTEESITMFRARSNILKLREWYRHVGEDTECIICREGIEDLDFFLKCKGLQQIGKKIKELQMNENKDNKLIMAEFLLFLLFYYFYFYHLQKRFKL